MCALKGKNGEERVTFIFMPLVRSLVPFGFYWRISANDLQISCLSLYRLSVAKEVGSEGSAAGGGRSDLSEWQRSARSKLVVTSAASAGHRNSKTD